MTKIRSVIEFASFARAPLILLLAYTVVYLLGVWRVLPPVEGIIESLMQLVKVYGLFIVGPVAILENMAIVNLGFPGAIIILVAMAAAHGNIIIALGVFLAIWCGSIIGLHGSYLLGVALSGSKYHKKYAQVATKSGYWKFFLGTFWHPQFASMSCFSLGVERVTYWEFVTPLLVSNFIWNCFWGITVYNFGVVFSDASLIKFLLLGYVLGWILFRFFKWGNAVTSLEKRNSFL